MFKQIKWNISNLKTKILTYISNKKCKMLKIIGFTLLMIFGIKYFCLKRRLKDTMTLLKSVQCAYENVVKQSTDLMLDNQILCEMVGMVLHVPGKLYT